jgi:two-component system response regulator YesN
MQRSRRFKAFMINVFARYIMPSMLVMLLIFAVLGVYMFRFFEDSLQERTVDSTLNSLSQIRARHESNLVSMYNIANQAAYSPGMTPFTLQKHADRAFRIKQMLSMFNINDGVFDQIVLTYAGDDYYYTARTSCHEDMFYQSGLVCEKIDAQTLHDLVETVPALTCLPGGRVSGVIPVANTGKYVLFLSPFGQGNAVRYGTLIFMVSDQTYQNWFSQQIENARNVYIAQSGQIIASRSDFDLPRALIGAHLDGTTARRTEKIDHDGRVYLVVSLPGNTNDMQYVTVLSMDDILREGRGEQRIFWSLLLALSALCLVVIGVFSYRTYSPVRRLRSLLRGQSETEDDFDAIESGILSLIGQNNALNTQLDTGRKTLQGQLVLQLVKRRFSSQEEILRAAQRSGLDCAHPYFAFVLTSTDEVTRRLLPSLLPACGAQPCGAILELLAQDQLLTLLLADDPAQIDGWIDNILARLRREQSKSPVARSSICTDLTRADSCYMEASAAYDARFIMGDQYALRFEQLAGRIDAPAAYPSSQIELLEKAIRSGDASAVDAALDAILSHLKSMRLSLYAFRCIYNEILSVIQRAAAKRVGQASFSLYDAFTLAACQNIDDLDVALRDALGALMRAGAPQGENMPQDAALADEIACFMRENYGDASLSMAVVSERFGISTVKLSLLFKEAVGMSPSDYLSMIRINSACGLLKHTTLSIKQISAQVGYCDVSSFIRRFKATTAMTPLKYRNDAASGDKNQPDLPA